MTIDVSALEALWQQAFGDTESFIEGFFHIGFSPERCRCIQREGKIAAALYWFDCLWDGKKVAYIYGVATDKAFRGQGLCRQLMADTHAHLQAAGYVGAALVPAEAGLAQMYDKMGYRGFCPMETRVILPGSTAADVEKIGPTEYGFARQKLLPAGSIAQDEISLDFYATYGEFYRYGSTVFCGAREKDTLYIQEFLGDPTQLPGIVTALGCGSAQVRLPGGDRDFAMYRSFTEENTLPSYLGIALD